MPTSRHPYGNALSYVWSVATLAWVPMTQPGGGGGGGSLTDAELRATPVPISGTVTVGNPLLSVDATGSAVVASILNIGQLTMSNSIPVVLASNQTAVPITAAALPLPAGAATSALQTTGNTSVGSVDTKTPALGQALAAASVPVVLTAAQITTLTPVSTVTANAGTNLNTSALGLETTQAAIKTAVELIDNAVSGAGFNVTQQGGVAVSLNTGVRDTGTQRVTIATNDVVPVTGTFWQATQPVSGTVTVNGTFWQATQPVSGTVTITPPTLTKGTQGATGLSTQDLKDAGRNQTNYFHAAPIITTTAEVMQSLTGYKAGAAVAATVTPAVVTSGKTYRITSVVITYWGATVIGGARVNLRANLSGAGVVGSPLVYSWQVGIPAVFTAGSAMTYTFPFPDGMEFVAGTGIAVGVIGEGAVPTTGTITGYVMLAIHGYEY